MDWTDGSLGLYGQAVANARLAGLEISNFIKRTFINPSDVHLIGHSLGAHLAGKDAPAPLVVCTVKEAAREVRQFFG